MKSQAPLPAQESSQNLNQVSPQGDSALDGFADVTLRYRLESGVNHSTWIADCGYQTAGQLEIQAGPYTLTQYTDKASVSLKAAERLCSLATPPAVLRVDAVTSSPRAGHIWYEAAEAGTLADYCRVRGKLPLSQATAIARSLTAALSYLHQQELAYQQFGLEHCVFTIKGELKVLAPDLDLRTLPETVQQSKKAEDIAACAAILWFCLTGKEPKAQRLRAPLSLSVPQASDALAQTLEDAIDLRANQPKLTDIVASFDLIADASPLELHLSAHESVLSRLPAYTPPELEPLPQSPRSRISRSPKTYGQPRKLSQKPLPQALIFLGKRGKNRSALPLLGASGLVAVAGLAIFLPGAQGPHKVTGEVQALGEGRSSEPMEVQNLAVEHAEGERSEKSVDSLTEEQKAEIAQQVSALIQRRSDVLSSGQNGRLQEYALPGAELENSDRVMLAQEAASELSQMSSKLVSIEEITVRSQGGYTVTAVVEAQGYNPRGDERELARIGMVRQGEQIMQKVDLALQPTEEGLRIESARPIAGN